jgi:hypothetical protein
VEERDRRVAVFFSVFSFFDEEEAVGSLGTRRLPFSSFTLKGEDNAF